MLEICALFCSFFALIPFDLTTECQQVHTALEEKIPGYVWNIREIGDGNINYIYLADAKEKKVLLKKALDYARINPEKFPLPIERLFFEYKAYTLYQGSCPERIPEIYFYDQGHGILAMQYLAPHVILRKGLLAGVKYPDLAEHLGTFLGKSLYLTSCYHLSETEWCANADLFSKNVAMRNIIESLNFTDPFFGSTLNWWTSPELDAQVLEIQNDPKVQAIVQALKDKFLTFPEALCHGDLHTGSILTTENDTRVIDTEFAYYAPISFDIGMLLANFITAALAAKAHGIESNWLFCLAEDTWNSFEKTFRGLWKNPQLSVDDKLQEIWSDTLRLIGIEIIRRTIGVAHNADFESIADRNLKVSIEQRALSLARKLILEAEKLVPNAKAFEILLKAG